MNASKAAMDAQRPRTNAAVAGFRVAAAKAASLEPAADKPVARHAARDLNRLPELRAEVDAGTIPALTAFEDYTATGNAIDPYAAGLSDFDGSRSPSTARRRRCSRRARRRRTSARRPLWLAACWPAAASCPRPSTRCSCRRSTTSGSSRRLADSPNDWQESPNPYAPVDASPAFKNLQKLENAIIAGRAGAPLPVSPTAWQAGVGTVFAKLTAAESATRLDITSGQARASDAVIRNVIVVGGAGLLAVIVSSVLLLGFGNRISRELTGLRGAARTLADERLPSVVSRLRAGGDVDVAVEAPPLNLGTRTREVTETADAFSAVQRTAVEAAVEQAQLRSGVSRVFRSLARRNQSLLQRQLKLLDEMERATEEPDALAQLFRLDHLTTRMRRQAEGLIILSGAAPGRTWRQPVAVVEVLRGAIGEIEDFARVDLVTDSPDFVQGTAVADVTHMLAELIENAVQYSPPGTKVQVRGGRVANGYVIEVEDRGLGIPLDIMETLNERLAKPPEFDLADSDQLGLFVVSRLAARHSVKISLRVSGYGGTSAVVLLPRTLVVAEDEVPALAGEGRQGGAGRRAGGDRGRLSVRRGVGWRSGGGAGLPRLLRPERGLGVDTPAAGRVGVRSGRHRRTRDRAGRPAAPGAADQHGAATAREPPGRAPGTAGGPLTRAGPVADVRHPAGTAERPRRRYTDRTAIPRPAAKAPAPGPAGVRNERRTRRGRA